VHSGGRKQEEKLGQARTGSLGQENKRDCSRCGGYQAGGRAEHGHPLLDTRVSKHSLKPCPESGPEGCFRKDLGAE
jgi:hypothetical protein